METQQFYDFDVMKNQAGDHHFDEQSDECLLETLAAGVREAMEPLYHRYSSLLYSLAYRMVGNQQVAEDVVQETFLALWQHVISYSPQKGSVRSWLISLMRHRTIDYLRRVRSRSSWKDIPWQGMNIEEEVALPDVWEGVWDSMQQALVREALLQLPPEQRMVILLAYFRGWTHAQIAQECQLPLGTVKARIRLGLRHLEQILEQEGIGASSSVSNTKRKNMHLDLGTMVVIRAIKSSCVADYELCRDGMCSCFGYTEWEALLEQIDAFEFVGSFGSFTARKEMRRHQAYWYVLRKGSLGRKKVRLGRSSELRLAHLEEVAKQLHEEKFSKE